MRRNGNSYPRWLIPVIAVTWTIPPSVAVGGFDEWKEAQSAEFQEFRQQRDREFHEFLQAEWEAFQVFRGEPEDDAPKPVDIPTAQPEPPPDGTPEAAPSPIPDIQPEPVEPLTDPDPGEPSGTTDGDPVDISFIGHELTIHVPPDWRELRLGAANRQAVADFWEAFASQPARPVVDQLREIGERLGLNGWGHLRLTHTLARALVDDANTAVATAWALLLKSGEDVRAGYQGGRLFLLYSAREQLYDTSYFELEGTRYYVFQRGDESLDRLVSYDADYRGADSALGVAPRTPPRAGDEPASRTLEFRFRGKAYQLEVPVSEALMEYLSTVPQMDLPAYFHARPDPALERALVEPLREAARGFSSREQVNLLLRFVQTAFEYQTDQEQFGTENYLFPGETVYYPASDCEDRAALFAWLARRVLGRDVAALDYPGHVATALDLDDGAQGKRIRVDKRALLVADPTYINADAGMVMPKYRDQQAKTIPLWE